MYAKGKQKPTVGPTLGCTELRVLTLKPMFIDLPGVLGIGSSYTFVMCFVL